MTTLFVSDLHLSPERPDVTLAFCDFLEHDAARADALFILGDLFEVWIGDDDPTEPAATVMQSLAALGKHKTRLFVQHGNRDFLLGRRFARATGATLLPDRQVVDIYGTHVLLMHGDRLCTDDVDYQRFRRRVRNPLYKWVLAHLPMTKRLAIATAWRAKSSAANANKPEQIMDVSQIEVEQILRDYKVRTLVHGHTHRPGRHEFEIDGESAERIVLGDWNDKGWVLRGSREGFELESFAIPSTT